MKTKRLTQALERVEAWPAYAQDELAEIARDIDESLRKGEYQPTAAELAGIDRGLRDAAEGRFATDNQVETALAKLRAAPCQLRLLTASTLHGPPPANAM